MVLKPCGTGLRLWPFGSTAFPDYGAIVEKKIMEDLDKRSYFFEKGLSFECQQCGACCTGSPGSVYVNKSEISDIAKFFKTPVENFKEKYLYPFKNSYSIKEHSDGRCIFYNDGCEIYPVRPGQCSSYPFWFINLRSEKKWQDVSKECVGIGKGTLHSKKKILEIVQTTFPWLMSSLFGTPEPAEPEPDRAAALTGSSKISCHKKH